MLTKPKYGFSEHVRQKCGKKLCQRREGLRLQDDAIEAERKEEAEMMCGDSDGRGVPVCLHNLLCVCVWIYVFVCVFVLNSVTSVIHSIFFLPSSAYQNVVSLSPQQYCQFTEPTVNPNAFDNISFKHSHYTSMWCFKLHTESHLDLWVWGYGCCRGCCRDPVQMSEPVFGHIQVYFVLPACFYLFWNKQACNIRGYWLLNWRQMLVGQQKCKK